MHIKPRYSWEKINMHMYSIKRDSCNKYSMHYRIVVVQSNSLLLQLVLSMAESITVDRSILISLLMAWLSVSTMEVCS